MAVDGAKYRAVNGALTKPYGENGLVVEVVRGVGTITPTTALDVSGPAHGGSPVFTIGNDIYRAQFIGRYTESSGSPSTIAGVRAGSCTLQFGNGEKWAGTVKITGRQLISDWDNPQEIAFLFSVTYSGSVTVTTGAV